jgi:hypothetical protein
MGKGGGRAGQEGKLRKDARVGEIRPEITGCERKFSRLFESCWGRRRRVIVSPYLPPGIDRRRAIEGDEHKDRQHIGQPRLSLGRKMEEYINIPMLLQLIPLSGRFIVLVVVICVIPSSLFPVRPSSVLDDGI